MAKTLQVVALALLFSVCLQADALAYIDPGSGSVITSAILGFFAAIAYTLRKSFYRLKDFFKRKPSPEERPS